MKTKTLKLIRAFATANQRLGMRWHTPTGISQMRDTTENRDEASHILRGLRSTMGRKNLGVQTMTKQHTSGPWEFSGRTCYGLTPPPTEFRQNGESIIPLRPIVFSITEAGITSPDRHLIEAAPELLAACKRALSVIDAEAMHFGVYKDKASADIIRNAINKAEEYKAEEYKDEN